MCNPEQPYANPPLVDFVEGMTGLICDYVLEVRITPETFTVVHADVVDGFPTDINTVSFAMDNDEVIL